METRKPDIHIPREIWENKELTVAEKCIFAQIHFLDDPEQHCYASNEYFSNFFQLSERTVSRAIAHLLELKYISKVNFNGRARTLKSNIITALDTGDGLKKLSDNNGDGEADLTKCLPCTDKMSTETRQNVYSPLTKCLSKEYIKNNNKNKNKNKNKEVSNDTSAVGRKSEETFSLYGNQNHISAENEFTPHREKKEKSGKKNLYQQCVDEINTYTANTKLRTTLVDYLGVNLKLGRKSVKSASMFKYLLQQLDKLAHDDEQKIAIVTQSIVRGWGSFFEIGNTGGSDKFGEGFMKEKRDPDAEARKEKEFENFLRQHGYEGEM